MERDLYELARRQHGVISRQQAHHAGLTDRAISERLRSGRWQRVHPGVYRMAGSAASSEQALFAAWLAAGPRAVVSHGSAAFLWGVLAAPIRPALTVPRPAGPKLVGCDVHRSRDLADARVRNRHGLPCTDPLRTVVDLAQVLTPSELDAAIDAALSTRLVTVAGLVAEMDRLSTPGRVGVGRLRTALSRRGLTGSPTPSALESRGAAFLQRYRIPVAGAEVRHGPQGEYRVDFLLVPGVVSELDGYAWHHTPEHKRRDEARRRTLQLEGNQVLVATWRDLREDPLALVRDLRQAVGGASLREPPGTPGGRPAGLREGMRPARPAGLREPPGTPGRPAGVSERPDQLHQPPARPN